MDHEFNGRWSNQISRKTGVAVTFRNMHIAKRLTIDNVNLDNEREMDAFDDQVLTAGIQRVRAEGDELRQRGILDWTGELTDERTPG